MSRSIRFQPDPLDHAQIDFNFEGKDFTPTAVALIMNESYTGCSLIVKTNEPVTANHKIKVKVGRIGILSAKVVWVKKLEDSLFQIGVQFLE